MCVGGCYVFIMCLKRNNIIMLLQVAALAPLALLLVLEARCASIIPTQHIYKLVSEH